MFDIFLDNFGKNLVRFWAVLRLIPIVTLLLNSKINGTEGPFSASYKKVAKYR
jgi:hypothetical protein